MVTNNKTRDGRGAVELVGEPYEDVYVSEPTVGSESQIYTRKVTESRPHNRAGFLLGSGLGANNRPR